MDKIVYPSKYVTMYLFQYLSQRLRDEEARLEDMCCRLDEEGDRAERMAVLAEEEANRLEAEIRYRN